MVTQLTYLHSLCEKKGKDFSPEAAQCWAIWQYDNDIVFDKIFNRKLLDEVVAREFVAKRSIWRWRSSWPKKKL